MRDKTVKYPGNTPIDNIPVAYYPRGVLDGAMSAGAE
jgi:hypothetical protein